MFGKTHWFTFTSKEELLRMWLTSIPTMAFYKQLCDYGRPLLPCEVTCPQPYANACSQPCITSCGDSRAIVYPPPVVITFPGPILSSCPQESIVGTSAPLELGGSFGHGSCLEAQSIMCPTGSGRYSCRATFRPLKPSITPPPPPPQPPTKTWQEQEQIRSI
ncbi:feather keratin Cos1-1/Cos1-3/Cos2-1-like [Coturnix japonica]|uniref:feather keratin Cos1-1/Cos1-3/Cos2-1-like n=1 Tax=Coturnix japonica TaxID=93934 RepID=UPI0007774846|nr:feather keratin Cos1-1/Cos1-3/Cos2-1-like [Coturnix japonica]